MEQRRAARQQSSEPDWYGLGFWRSEPLWRSFERAAEGPGRDATITDGDVELGLKELLERALRIAGALATAGVRRGGAVIVQSRNSIDAYASLLACFSQGYVAIPLPPMFSPGQVAAVANSAGAQALLLLEAEIAEGLSEIRQAASGLGAVFTVGPINDGPGPVSAWSTCLNASPLTPDPPDPDADAMVLYSSGSTGTPKGVVHSGNSLRFGPEALAQLHHVGPADRVLVALEFGFVGGTVLVALLAFLAGASTVLMRRWDAAACLGEIERRKITYTLLMPTHSYDVLNHPDLERRDTQSLARAILAGASPAQRRRAAKFFCGVPMSMYGMSESIGHCTCAPTDAEADRCDTDGRPLPGTEMRILDDDGNPVKPGEIGNIFLRGPNRLRRYQARPELTEQAITPDGWYRTGDRGRFEPGGFMTFVARASELIRRGGMMIQPAEVEAALREHPAVTEVAVVGIADERLGERACACLTLKPDSGLDLEAMREHLSRLGLPRYQWPEFLLVFDEFPRTPSLKVRRSDLRQLASSRLSSLRC